MNNCAIYNENSAKENNHKPSNTYTKRIGSTTYVVTVNFSNTSKETLEDKLLRLINREVENIV